MEHLTTIVLVLVAGLLTLVGVVGLTCTGWGNSSNNVALLGLRAMGGAFAPWAAVYLFVRKEYLSSAAAMAFATLFTLWLENGWGFVQPASGFSMISILPLLATCVTLAVHLVNVDAIRTATSR